MTPRPLRADAARNQAGILRAARTLIRSHGPGVGMDEIAREAGVAVGTLYRHFPAKSDLVEAIARQIAGQLAEDLDAAVARVDRGGQARDELVSLFTRLAEITGTDQALKLAISHLAVTHPGVAGQLRDLEQRVTATLARIVAAAHDQGSLYPDVTADDLALLLAALPGAELPEADRQRWVQLTLRGLLTRSVSAAGELRGTPGQPVDDDVQPDALVLGGEVPLHRDHAAENRVQVGDRQVGPYAAVPLCALQEPSERPGQRGRGIGALGADAGSAQGAGERDVLPRLGGQLPDEGDEGGGRVGGVGESGVEDEEYRGYLAAQGLPEEVIDGLLGLYAEFRSGWAATPSPDLGRLLGRDPVDTLDAVRQRVPR